MTVSVYRAPDDSNDAAPRRARPATLSAEDREFARVRMLLCALRPGYADPLHPAPPAPTELAPVRVRDPMAGWGDVPRALCTGGAWDEPAGTGAPAHIVDLPEDARAVCSWLRERAVLEPGALRALYFDLGEAFADADQAEQWAHDLTARRDGACHLGRTLVLEAAKAWGIPEF